MLKHYLTLAYRTLRRNKFHTAINVTGLSIGITACLVIYLIVSFELSFNKQMPDYNRIYRIHCRFDGTFTGLNRAVPTGVEVYAREQLKGVEDVSLMMLLSGSVQIPTATGPRTFDMERAIALVTADYFKVFNAYEWLAGSPSVFLKPHQVVLTERQARKYFGPGDLQAMIGKDVIYRDSLTMHVAGVVADLSGATDLTFTEFISMPTVEAGGLSSVYPLNNWSMINSSNQIFIKALPGTT